jgi:cytoskeletal protein CcmA (bactofilin family)
MFNKKNPEREEMNEPKMNEPTPLTPSHSSPSTTTPLGGATTVLAEGCTFDGTANVEGTLRIEGQVRGEIDTTESLVVAKCGDVEAQAKVRHAIVNGRFQGKIHADDCVELQSGGRVDAEIRAKNMVMEDGVRFEGHCKIGV